MVQGYAPLLYKEMSDLRDQSRRGFWRARFEARLQVQVKFIIGHSYNTSLIEFIFKHRCL